MSSYPRAIARWFHRLQGTSLPTKAWMHTMREIPLAEKKHIESAFAQFPSGVAAIAAVVDGAPVGLVATSFTVGVSFEPPQVLFAAQRSSRTWPVLARATRIGVSVLAQGHEQACYQLASRSGDRFAGLDIHTTASGALFLREAVMWLECRTSAIVPSGDHELVLLEVERVHADDEVEPLVYHGRAFRPLQQRAQLV